MRFDFHTNLGTFPGSDSHGKDHICSVEELVEHCNKFKITHAIVLYPYDGYAMLEEAQSKTDAKLYGLQCMFFNHKPEFGHYPELSELPLDIDKPLCYGTKFHSHRGYYNINGEIQNGLDYGNNRLMGKVLKRLPTNAIVSCHLQGTASPYNTSRPMSLGNLACKYPHLKFIMNHAGDYGPRAFTGRPSSIIDKQGRSGPLLSHLKHRESIASAVSIAEVCHNVFLDGSNFTIDKAKILSGTPRWCVGTDIPFADPQYYNFDKEEADWIKWAGDRSVKNGYRHALNFMEKDIEHLLKVQQRYYGFSYVRASDKPIKVKE